MSPAKAGAQDSALKARSAVDLEADPGVFLYIYLGNAETPWPSVLCTLDWIPAFAGNTVEGVMA